MLRLIPARPGALAADASPVPDGHKSVRIWLFAVAALVALLVTIGGATRLTGSGLSITEWQPIIGVVPPLSDHAWHEAFDKYKAIPQYQQLNAGMSLAAFKTIYWWEWSHRFLGRLVGVVFAVPLVTFVVRGRIRGGLALHLTGLLALGALQGFIGWYMVRSGLADRVTVSPYRLALHLGLAFLLLGLLLWTALRVRPAPVLAADARPSNLRPAPLVFAIGADSPRALPRSTAVTGLVLLALIFLQVLAGALVAGLKAGLTHNTWPLMDGAVIPSGLGLLKPWHLNLFENPTMVQFNHRILAYAIAAVSLIHAWRLRPASNRFVKLSATVVAVLILMQIALGVWTLLAWVPLSLGLAHQGLAVLVFAAAVWHVARIRDARRAH